MYFIALCLCLHSFTVSLSLSLSLLTNDIQIAIHPIYAADIMGDGVGHNTMGLLTVCTGITWGREKRMQFDGYGIATTGPLSHIWDIVTCVMEIIWREMTDIIGVPEWILLMMDAIDRSGHHRVPIAPH